MTRSTGVGLSTEERDAVYARLGQELSSDPAVPEDLKRLAEDPRVTVRRGGPPARGRCVVYWMQRAQRGRDNHAVDTAVHLANALGLPCVAYFAVVRNFPHANLRHYAFMAQGLADVQLDCADRGIGFAMRRAPDESPVQFFADVDAAIVISDENPLRFPEQWRVNLADQISIPFWTVDADVVVPSKLLGKAQFSAGVIRPRLTRLLPEFLQPFDNPQAAIEWKPQRALTRDTLDGDITRGWEDFDRSVKAVDAWHGGSKAALKRLTLLVSEKLKNYDRERNKPEIDGTSKLSPFLHFGHIGPATIALCMNAAAKQNPKLEPARDSFFNELIVWRELSVNFVRYQPEYDSVECADNWARSTIELHDRDERAVLYTLKQMEAARTHDELWNAAQLQMVHHGWMHNYLRMYWAKKILEWSPDAGTAMKRAIYLNDRYFLDGRDPNGYAGIAWAILGKFDRAWGERPVFGKRRYMSAESTARKFDSRRYIERMRALAGESAAQATLFA